MERYKLPFLFLPTLAAQEIAQAAQLIDDASRLNSTLVADIVDIRSDKDVSLALIKAQMLKTHVSIAGQRHSMGGQTFGKDHLVLNMLPFHQISYDETSGIVTAQAGATWAEIMRVLDPIGRAVWVMQSDCIFTVGGTISVNAHGWHPRQGPVSSTVEGFRMMLASGEIKNCSRTENPQLFHAALGGYGLLGVILDVRLRTIPNRLYRQASCYFPAADYAAMFDRHVANNPNVELAYGRLSIDQDNFLTEAGLHVFEAVEPPSTPLPAMEEESMVEFKRFIFNRSAKNDAGKRRRWTLEKRLAAYHAGHTVTRNTAMNADIRVVWHPTAETREILHEYFVPYRQLPSFLEALRMQVKRYDLNLLNVTLRDIKMDNDTLLRYAKTDVCALVLFFTQPATAHAEETMQQFTTVMVDQALGLGGSFYLPYRAQYSAAQFLKAYPGAQKFVALKRRVDPGGLFASQFSQRLFSS